MEDQDRGLSPVAGAQETHRRASEPLKTAITIGNLCMCKEIVQQGVNLNAQYQDCNGCTTLLYSLRQYQPAIAEYLALEGAAPAGKICHHFNPWGYSVFHLVASFNYFKLLRILLERHPNQYLHLTDPMHPFHLAIISGATECVSSMISHVGKGRISSKVHRLSIRLTTLTENILTSTAFHQYAKSHAYYLVNLRVGILNPGVTCRAAGTNDTPLVLAIDAKNREITRLLLEAGGLVDEGGSCHRTQLHHAASLGDGDMVKLLLDRGANPQVWDRCLRTPAMCAAEGGTSACASSAIRAWSGS